MTQEKLDDLRNGFETAYIDRTYASNLAYKQQFIKNLCSCCSRHGNGASVQIGLWI